MNKRIENNVPPEYPHYPGYYGKPIEYRRNQYKQTGFIRDWLNYRTYDAGDWIFFGVLALLILVGGIR